MSKPTYNLIATDLDDLGWLMFTTRDLVDAQAKLDLMVEAIAVPNILMSGQNWKSIRLEKSEVLSIHEVEDEP